MADDLDLRTRAGWCFVHSDGADEGRIRVIQLDAIAEVIDRLSNAPPPREQWVAALAALKRRGGHYVSIASIAQQPGASNNPVKMLISSWASTWEGVPIAELLPGFVD